MADTDFPQDLRDAQIRLHRVHCEYAALCRALPWSVEPHPGWTGDKQPYSDYVGSMPDSPGYTEQQKADEARLRAERLELSIFVSTHPYWSTVERDKVVDERMRLKRISRPAEGAAPAAHEAV
ncbi:hypothetical protein [Streptomyces sp. NPDC002889]|uniref:hypothetical protein n=1 Tax=Streptomyces sp. NPDC002889 TaxID=3364669 RepID=UPI0036B4C7CA